MTNRLGLIRPCVECDSRPHWLEAAHSPDDHAEMTRHHVILGIGAILLVIGVVLFLNTDLSVSSFGDIILAIGLGLTVWGWRGSQRAARRARALASRG